ncbi:transmembrane protein 176B isoform X1 [Peromyscus californicus insignis]|uniref:transmembrane protein 176B isoform X1 n=1 Tax=Peromyscus californicus insignis TaxID=564181 RepID=UPI0022A73DDA|nr:transmembrane protein 176B isoform X1 [Peromyscus californicus insignis]XP_052577081.1 transmembrane protein 176B isoform X1 [Peromyscus californicus insignis]
MTQTTVTVNGAEVASALPQSTHISIHIHHQSTLEQLLRAIGSPKKFFSCLQDTGPSKASIHHGQLALGVTQILLGFMSCVLGVCIYFGPWTGLCASGCAFWSGSVAIVAGAGTIVHEKRRGKLSMSLGLSLYQPCPSTLSKMGHISCLLILACIATAVAATILGVNSLIWQTSASYYFKISSTCDPLQSSMGSGYGIMRYTSDSDWKIERCKSSLNMVMNLFLAFCIMFTIVCILKIVVSLASLVLSLRSMCGQSSQALDEEETEKKLLGGDSTPPSPTKEIPVIL